MSASSLLYSAFNPENQAKGYAAESLHADEVCFHAVSEIARLDGAYLKEQGYGTRFVPKT